MMLGEESDSAAYWKACGDAALANNIKGVIMMGAHWDSVGENSIEVATNPQPAKSPVAYVHPSKYVDYKLNPDLQTADRVINILNDSGFKAKGNDKFDWIHDTYLILIRMFPGGCPPTTIISMNARFDPHMHMRVGTAVHSLRNEGYLLIGTGGAVHAQIYSQVGGIFRENLANVATGGAIHYTNYLELDQIRFLFNSALQHGGALHSSGPGAMPTRVTRSEFANNAAAGDGGALYSRGVVVLSNSTISANGAGGDAGGIYIREGSAVTATVAARPSSVTPPRVS